MSNTVTNRRRARTPGSPAARRQVAALRGLVNFTRRKALVSRLKTVSVTPKTVASILDQATKESQPRARLVSAAILEASRGSAGAAVAATSIVSWGTSMRAAGPERRPMVCAAFRAQKANLLLIHGIASLPPEEAGAFMRTYFDTGGDMKSVAQWLAIAGAVTGRDEVARRVVAMSARGGRGSRRLTRRQAASTRRKLKGFLDDLGGAIAGAAGAVGGAVADAAGAVGDALAGAGSSLGGLVGNVVGALLEAGKGVGDVVAAAAGWTADQVQSVVGALVAAGKSVAEILEAAVAHGVLRKFVEALIAAGRATAEVLAWAASEALAVVQETLAALLAVGRSIGEMLAWAAEQAVAVAEKMVRALVALGHKVRDLVVAAIQLSTAALRTMIRALYAVVRKASEILVAVAGCALSVLRTVLEGLFMAGVTLLEAVASICVDVAEGFRRGFFEGLIALGHAAVDLVKAAVRTGLSIAALAFAAIMEIFGGHRALTAAELTEARRVFGWSIDLERVKVAVASLPADLVNYVNGDRPFTTMYVINFASWSQVTMQTLIHELTHVWQATGGPVYMIDALHSQLFGRGYEVTAADLAAAGSDITRLEPEQQATVVERYWAGRWGGVASWKWQDYEPLARCVYAPRPRVPGALDLPGGLLGRRPPRDVVVIREETFQPFGPGGFVVRPGRPVVGPVGGPITAPLPRPIGGRPGGWR